MKPLVYISSPYTQGDTLKNVAFQHRTWDRLRASGLCTPIAPLWSHYQHQHSPLSWEEWIDYDLEIVARCDYLLRLDAVDVGYFQRLSKGADVEVAFANKLGIPVYTDVEEFIWNLRSL